jgi:DNA-binding transcriptional ArsR family regulator
MRKPKPITNIDDPRWVRAIAHPLRIRLLAMLDEQEASPVGLADKLEQPLGTVSYHVRTLYELGLLDLVRTRPRRGATEHFYRTRGHPAFSDEAWDRLGVVPKQRMISAALQQIHDYAARSAGAGGFDRADAHFSRAPLKLDRRGWTELAGVTKKWLERALAIEEASAKRLKSDPHATIDVGLVILLFEALPFSAELAGSPEQQDPISRRQRKPKMPGNGRSRLVARD